VIFLIFFITPPWFCRFLPRF